MVNKNIQMKKRNNDEWENLFPLTLNENVFNNNGVNLNDQLDNMNTVIQQDLNDLTAEQETTKTNVTNLEGDVTSLEGDMTSSFNHYDGLKDQKYIDVKNNNDFNAIGDNESHTIEETFPNVTLSQVTELNPNATLQNQADWFAIQTAMKKGLEEGKEVFLSSGRYRIDLPLEYGEYQRIRGEGANTRLYSYVSDDFLLKHELQEADEEGSSRYTSFKDFYINGTNHLGSGGGFHYRHSGHGSVISGLWIKYFTEDNQIGFKATRTWYMYMYSCDISNNYQGMVLGDTGFHNTVNGLVIRDTKVQGTLRYNPKTDGYLGINIVNGSGNIISACQVEGWETGIRNDTETTGTVVENSFIEDNGYRAITDFGQAFKLSNCYFYHPDARSNTEIHLSSSSVGAVIENPSFRNITDISDVFEISSNSEGSVVINPQLYHGDRTTEELIPTLRNVTTSIVLDKDEDNNTVPTMENQMAFNHGIVLNPYDSGEMLPNTLHLDNNGRLTLYDGTDWIRFVEE